MPISVSGLVGVTIRVDGHVLASQRWEEWPTNNRKNGGKVRYLDFWSFENCDGLTFEGSGKIDGQGYMWWMREYTKTNKAHRPRLVYIGKTRNIEWSGVMLLNSPSFHIIPEGVENVYMHDFEIYVDSWG